MLVLVRDVVGGRGRRDEGVADMIGRRRPHVGLCRCESHHPGWDVGVNGRATVGRGRALKRMGRGAREPGEGRGRRAAGVLLAERGGPARLNVDRAALCGLGVNWKACLDEPGYARWMAEREKLGGSREEEDGGGMGGGGRWLMNRLSRRALGCPRSLSSPPSPRSKSPPKPALASFLFAAAIQPSP